MMRATIKDLDALWANPTPGMLQVINGRRPYDRLGDVRTQAKTRMRRKQIKRYDSVRERDAELIKEDREAVTEVLKAARAMKRDLKRGLITPDEVMQKVARSIKGAEELVEHVRQVERDEEAATAMVDMPPGDYEQSLLERFPAQGAPILTEEFLCGEDESPFHDEADA